MNEVVGCQQAWTCNKTHHHKAWYFVDQGKVTKSNEGDIRAQSIFVHKIDLTSFKAITNIFTEKFYVL